jgi:GH18 family chitinase
LLPFLAMKNVRSVLGCTFALLAVPLLGACSGSSTDGSPLEDSGTQGSEDGGEPITPAPDSGGGASDTEGGWATPDGGGATTPEGGADSGGNEAVDAAPDVGTVTTPAIKAVMYLPNWNGSFSSWASMIDFTKMTHLLLAFGTVDTNNNWNMGASDSDVQTLAAAAHSNGVKILVSIGGADDDIGIINQYQTASNITPLVANLNSMVTRLNLDGVDVDLERGTLMQSSSNYPAFINQLISTSRPNGMLVTTALAQYIAQDANSDATLQAVYQSFDFINDMIYTTNMSDFTGEASWWTGTQGITKTKLCWGIEFTSNLSTNTAIQLTKGSEAYGGVMMWEYTQSTESTLWPAIQSAL